MAVVMAVWKNMGRIRRRSMEGMGGGLLSFFLFLGGRVYWGGAGYSLADFLNPASPQCSAQIRGI